MCPLCIGTAWLIAGGVGSAGGMATVAWRSVSKRRRGVPVAREVAVVDERRHGEAQPRVDFVHRKGAPR